jgi:pimeloyl-ACP methyl ester carboxylesterase
MTATAVPSPRQARRARVIALHCSGGGAGEWGHLGRVLGGRYELLAPEHYGCGSTGPWSGEHAFTLADEAARTTALIDESEDKVHLVGHSYGGGVALKAALARPEFIAGMVLYEPTAFHLLRQMGAAGAEAHTEIASLAWLIGQGILSGDYRKAAARFVDYWNGAGAWSALRPSVQSALIRWAPKGPLEFRALLEEETPPRAYRALSCPVLILCGEHAPMPTRIIAERLAELISSSRLVVVAGAGHMGPVTHDAPVSELIVRHIAEAEAEAAARPPRTWRPRTLADILIGAPRHGRGTP